MFSLLQKLYLEINDDRVAAAVFCDLTKAFDCVNHKILLDKLEKYGFRGIALKWFQSYLNNRIQKVTLNDQSSMSEHIYCGVPQGSVLGPVLFLIYFNNIVTINIQGQFAIFADDSTVLWLSNNNETLHRIISRDIELIKQWCDANYLTFNISKTNIVCFKCEMENISMGAEIINVTNENKFLGLSIDYRLKFERHINLLCKNLASGCFAVRSVTYSLSLQAARNVYFALIESHLWYGICFWGACSDELFNSLYYAKAGPEVHV